HVEPTQHVSDAQLADCRRLRHARATRRRVRSMAVVRVVVRARPMNVPPDDRTANLALWVVIAAVLVGWQLFTMLFKRLPTVAVVFREARRFWLTRWFFLLGSVWLGWHLFVRTST